MHAEMMGRDIVPRKGQQTDGNRTDRRMLLEFGPGILEQLRAVAIYKDMPPTVMVRGWVVERLRDEQRKMPASEGAS